MADEKLSTWQQCKSIQEVLAHGNDDNAAAQRVRNALLRHLESTSERGVVLAAKLSRTNGPVATEPGDMEVLEALRQRMAGETGITVAHGHFSLDASLLTA
jgi:hypothetical protein